MKIKPVNLSEEEFEKLISSEVGHGSDGKVMRYDNKHLIKIYHSKLNQAFNPSKNDEDIKIYENGSENQNSSFENMFFYYKDDDGDQVRLRSEDAIYQAMKKQTKIKNTRLPSNAVYVNGHFVGCLIIASKGLQIHKLTGIPLKFKKKIMLQVLKNVKELLDNFIYHIDLDNSPYATDSWFEGELVGHSHVLVNPITLKPSIIDLDGKSTIYRESYSKEDEYMCLNKLTRLVIEFLLGIDLNEYSTSQDLEYVFRRIGIKAEYINDLVRQHMDYDRLEEFINDIEGIKRL